MEVIDCGAMERCRSEIWLLLLLLVGMKHLSASFLGDEMRSVSVYYGTPSLPPCDSSIRIDEIGRADASLSHSLPLSFLLSFFLSFPQFLWLSSIHTQVCITIVILIIKKIVIWIIILFSVDVSYGFDDWLGILTMKSISLLLDWQIRGSVIIRAIFT